MRAAWTRYHTSMRACRGFSFLEILITIGLIGVALVVFQATLSGSFLSEYAKDQGLARAIAGNELDALRSLGYSALPGSGTFFNGDLARLTNGSGAVSISDYATNIKRVTVTVSWTEHASGARALSLDTLIAKTGGLP